MPRTTRVACRYNFLLNQDDSVHQFQYTTRIVWTRASKLNQAETEDQKKKRSDDDDDGAYIYVGGQRCDINVGMYCIVS